MDSRTLSLSRVLTNEVRYTVPLFQRKYVWNEKDNWWPLWTDVVETTCRLMTDQSKGVGATRPHFLGAVVHEGLLPKTGQMPEQRIIDGQQRMTTLQLLLTATRAVASDCGEFPPLRWSSGYRLPAGAGMAIGGSAGSVSRVCQAVSYSFGLR